MTMITLASCVEGEVKEMLIITWNEKDTHQWVDGRSVYTPGKEHQKRWWVGYPMPTIRGRVVRMQADGDELDVLVKAIEDKSMKGGSVSGD